MRKIKLLLVTTLISFIFFLSFPGTTKAFTFDDVVNTVKDIFSPDKNQSKDKKAEVTIESDIALAPDGDVGGDGEIDSGDIVSFSYKISNTAENEYPFGTLNTNINRKQINFIHNIRAGSLNDDKTTITFPNLRLMAGQMVEVSFDARINYSTEEDLTISIEPEFLTQENKSVIKGVRKEINARKLDKEKFNSIQNRFFKRE